jgi:Carboxypeptidase regulatory-like domain/TonB dependent receptor
MQHRTLRKVVTGLITCIATSIALLAQTITGSINGNVTDQSGAVVANARVLVRNVATGVQTSGVTNAAGDYNLRFLQIGQYTVTVQAAGFADQTLGPVTLEVDQIVKVNVHLAVNGTTQQVTVNGDLQPILDTDNSRVATTFAASTIENIPLNGRNFSALTQFLPGSINTQPQQMSGVNAIERDTNQGGQVSVNGNRGQANNYRLDGIEINETINNTIGYNPAPEAIGNLTVITSNADAEFGNVNGGDVEAVLKSGTNQLHGGAYGYLQNDSLDANSWANNLARNPKQPYTQTIFGGTLGGPIKRDKLFFFVDYEGIRYHQGGMLAASVIPEAMRNGDFSALLTGNKPIQLYHFVPGQGQVPYVNNQVPIVNPAAKFLFAHPELYPLPNQDATPDTFGVLNNYRGSYRNIIFNNQGDVKIDYTVGPRDTIMGRYSQSDAGDQQTQAPLLITFPTASQYPFKGVAVNWIHTFSPYIVNEARAGFSRVRWIQGLPVDLTGAFGTNGNSLVGINAPQPYPGFTALAFNAQTSGSSNAANVPTTIGTTGGASNLIDNTFTYGDNLTIERGRHTFKMGVEILRYQQNNFYPGNTGAMGTFGYSGNFTSNATSPGYSVADFVSDQALVAGVGQITGRTGQRQYRDAGFFQDDWKLTPSLTVNLGLRYEYDQPIYEVNNKQANVDLATGTVYVAGQAGADKVFGDGKALYNPTYTNFMPRIGFAWQPMPRVVFRGGYGITNYLEGTGAALRLNYNPPFQGSFSETAQTPTPTSAGTPITVESGLPIGNNAPITSYNAWDKHLKPAFIQEFTFSNEIELTNQTSVSMTYLGQLGDHLANPRAANQLSAPGATAPFANLVGQTGSVVETQSEAIMKYNAFQLQVRHRQSNGLEYQVNYTWSHALTNNAGYFGVSDVNGASPYWQDANNGAADYGNAGFDSRHNLSATAVYQLPFGRGQKFGNGVNRWVDEGIGGWKLSGDAIVFSGLPVTINGPNNTNVFNRAERANQYRQLTVRNRSINNWFGTDPSATPCLGLGIDNGQCAYGAAGVGEFGSAANNTERAPGYEQIDLAASKTFTLTERQHLEFRTDFFNAFNIASYDNPDNSIQDNTFGKITNVRSLPRQIQMSLHYSF